MRTKEKIKHIQPLNRFIYFPTSYDKYKYPVVVYVVSGKLSPTWGGNSAGITVNVARDKSDAEEGRGRSRPLRRLAIYSDKLWEACMRWKEKQERLNKEFRQLMKGKIK